MYWLFLLFLVTVVVMVRRRYLPAMESRLSIPNHPFPISIPAKHQINSSKICLITGANGFIGRYLIERLLEEKGYSLIVATDTEKPRFLNKTVLNYVLDVTMQHAVLACFKKFKPSVVFHLAALVDTRCGWPHSARLKRINVDGTKNVATGCADKEVGAKLIFLSSASSGVPESNYGSSKLASEKDILSCGGICLRSSKVWGLGDKLGTEYILDNSVPALIKPDNLAGLCYVKNLAILLSAAANRGVNGTIYDVGDQLGTYREFTNRLNTIKGRTRVLVLPTAVAWVLAYITPVVDKFISVCLGGRPAPLEPYLVLNTAVLKLLDLPPLESWDWARAKKTFILLGIKEGEYLSFDQAMEDVKDLLPLSWQKRLPLAYDLGSEKALQLFRPARLMNSLLLRNHIVKAATFEGLATQDGLPTQELIDFHASISLSGVGMTTVAYGSVSEGGRSFQTQLVVSRESLPMLSKLTKACHDNGGRCCLQLTHAGFFALTPVAPSWPQFDFMHWKMAKKATKQDIKEITRNFSEAAIIAKQANFDAVEVHAGHGYLLSQFLSMSLNNRKDEYGGTPENRTRFVIEVLQAIRKAVPDLCILLKFNLSDIGGPRSAAILNERRDFVLKVQSEKLADALVPSGGMIMDNGFFMLRGSTPLKSMIKSPTSSWVTRLSVLLLGWYVIPTLPYDEAFFSEGSQYLLDSGVTLPIILTGGVHTLHTAEWAVRNGFWGVGMARALLNDPNLVTHWTNCDTAHQTCDNNNSCVVSVTFAGTKLGCVKHNDW